MVGDESALPAIAASLERSRLGAACWPRWSSTTPSHRPRPRLPRATSTVTWVHRDDDPANPDQLRAGGRGARRSPPGRPQVFVHGEAGEVRAVRRHLLAERGLSRDGTSISPYWRRDYTDERWREVKAAWLAESAQDA